MISSCLENRDNNMESLDHFTDNNNNKVVVESGRWLKCLEEVAGVAVPGGTRGDKWWSRRVGSDSRVRLTGGNREGWQVVEERGGVTSDGERGQGMATGGIERVAERR